MFVFRAEICNLGPQDGGFTYEKVLKWGYLDTFQKQ
jgi:hypothetical protein